MKRDNQQSVIAYNVTGNCEGGQGNADLRCTTRFEQLTALVPLLDERRPPAANLPSVSPAFVKQCLGAALSSRN